MYTTPTQGGTKARAKAKETRPKVRAKAKEDVGKASRTHPPGNGHPVAFRRHPPEPEHPP